MLGRRHGLEAGVLPVPALELLARALGRLDGETVCIAVQPFPVDAHARGDDELSHRMRCELLEQRSRAERVDRRVLRNLVHRLSDADARREVHDGVAALERPCDRLAVADVADLQLDLRVEVGGRHAAVHLLDEAVEHAHAVPGAQQLVRQVRPDEAAAAGHQYGARHSASSLALRGGVQAPPTTAE